VHHQRRVDAGFGADRAQRRTVEASFGEEAPRRLEDRFA
jgi:hypothetical protein